MMHGEPLDRLASAIQKRGLVTPAVLLLEMHKPLVGCLREMYTIAEPLALLVFGREWSPVIKDLLSSQENVEQLIERLEGTKVKA